MHVYAGEESSILSRASKLTSEQVNSRTIGWEPATIDGNVDEQSHNPSTPTSTSAASFAEDLNRTNTSATTYGAWHPSAIPCRNSHGSAGGRKDSSSSAIPFGYQSGIENYGPHNQNCYSSSQYAPGSPQQYGTNQPFDGMTTSANRPTWSSNTAPLSMTALTAPSMPALSFVSERHLPVPGTMPQTSLGNGPMQCRGGQHVWSDQPHFSSPGDSSGAGPPPLSARYSNNTSGNNFMLPTSSSAGANGSANFSNFTFSSENRNSVYNAANTSPTGNPSYFRNGQAYTSHNSG